MERLFMVLKLQTKVVAMNIFGQEEEVELSGCAGYCPVFSTLKEAEEHSHEGKYSIMEIKATEANAK